MQYLGVLDIRLMCGFFSRCSLFLLDRERNELVAKVFDGEIPGNGKHKVRYFVFISVCYTYDFSVFLLRFMKYHRSMRKEH